MAEHELQAAQYDISLVCPKILKLIAPRLHGEKHKEDDDSVKAIRDVTGGPLNADPKALPTLDEHDFIGEGGEKTPRSVSEDTEPGETEDGMEPNEHEKKHLRHIGESLPFSTFLVAFVELCERFTFYGCQGIFQVWLAKNLQSPRWR